MEQFEVRPAQIAETDLVKTLYDEVIEANTGTKYDVLWRRDLHPSDKAIEEAIEQGALVVAVLDGVIVGSSIMNHDFAPGYDQISWRVNAPLDEVLCLHLLCVHPSCQGMGLGRRFLDGLKQWSKEQGAQAIRLDVFDYNDPAKHLYETNGYELIDKTYLAYEDQEVSTILFSMYELAL